MKRIVFTQAVGKPVFAEMAMGLGRSLSLIGDSALRAIITDLDGYDWGRYFDVVLEPREPLPWVMFSKLTALNRTDADQVIFLDGDSLAFKKLDPVFDYCAGKGFAVQGQWQSDGFWHGDLAELCRQHGLRAIPKFNGGFMYYERGAEAALETFWEYGRRWKDFGFVGNWPHVPDEPCIALAMAKEGIGHLISEDMNFSNTALGLVDKLRMDVRTGECRYVCRRYHTRFVEPFVFHAARYKTFFVYWRQLARLKALERYEDRHGYGYMSPWQKLERSIQRRWLKYVSRKL